jgi:hypothetical protein
MSLTHDDLEVDKCYEPAEDFKPRPSATWAYVNRGQKLGKFIRKELRGSGDDRGIEADFSNKERIPCSNRDGENFKFKEVECVTGGRRKSRRTTRRASRRRNSRRRH